MSKNENVILTKIEGHEAKIILGSPEETAAKKKRADKLTAIKIALTYIESHGGRKMTPEKAMEIADKFLAWLEK